MRFLGLFLASMNASTVGLNVHSFWFLHFNDATSILDNYFKFWWASGQSCQSFSEILRISDKVGQLSLQFSKFHGSLVSSSPRNAAQSINTSRRFLETLRRIDNWVCDSLRIFFNNISVSSRSLQQKENFLENHRFSCQSFSEIFRISDKVWHEKHYKLTWLSQIKRPSLKFKKQKRFLST